LFLHDLDPVFDHAELQTEIADLAVLLRLLLSREEPSGDRAGVGQHADLVVELMQRDAVIPASREEQNILLDEG